MAKTDPSEAADVAEAQPTVVYAQPVPQTSLADRSVRNPNEVTLRFRRWYSDGRTAYMRGQEAGFSPGEADRILMARPPAAAIVERQSVAVAGMVRK